MANHDQPPNHSRRKRILAGAVASAALLSAGVVGYKLSQGGQGPKAPAALSDTQKKAEGIIKPALIKYGDRLADAYNHQKHGVTATAIPGTEDYVVFAEGPDSYAEGIMPGTITKAKANGKAHLSLNPGQTSIVGWGNNVTKGQTQHILARPDGAQLAGKAAHVVGVDNEVDASNIAMVIAPQAGLYGDSKGSSAGYNNPYEPPEGHSHPSSGQILDDLLANRTAANQDPPTL